MRTLKRRWFWPTALLLLVAGGLLLAMAQATPLYTDAEAYRTAVDAVRADLYAGDPAVADYHRASDAFFALQDRYRTQKWLYADLGYAALAWAALLTLLSANQRPLRASRRFIVVIPAALAAVGLLGLGAVSSTIQPFGREQLPEWSDTLALPLMGTVFLAVLLLPIVLVLSLTPLVLTRRSPASFWSVRGRGWRTAVLVTLIYLPPVGLALASVALFWQTGGWAVSAGGAILLWLMLNARAVWLGRRPDPPLP
jgi:hypothetical protein